MTEFDDLLDLCELDNITLVWRGMEVKFEFLEGFFHDDGKRYFLMLLEDRTHHPDGAMMVHGYICTRESWPFFRSPNTDEEWALVDEHFQLYQEEIRYALQHLNDDDEDADIPYL